MASIDPNLLALAAGQCGLFTTRQARDVGVVAKALSGHVAARRISRLARSLYAVSSSQPQSTEARHQLLARGASLLYDDAILTGVTAVLAHGLPVWNCPLGRPELLRPIHRQVGVKPYRVRPRHGAQVDSPWGPTVPLAEALVQLCLDHGIVQGVVSADAALHAGRLTPAELGAAVDAVRTWPKSNRPRAMLEFVDPKCESVAESRARVEFLTHGIRVRSQVDVCRRDGSLIGRADFVVEDTDVVVEVDGKVKYATGDPAVLWAEKRREDDMRAEGKVVVRVTWADLETPGRASAKVRRALPRTSGPPSPPEDDPSPGKRSRGKGGVP
jgi:very-short-patch-repair endonuclease